MLACASVYRSLVAVLGALAVSCGASGCTPARSGDVPASPGNILLRAIPPADSVVVQRDTVTIVLSMRDVEERAAAVGYDPTGSRSRFFQRVRNEYARNGWVRLDFEGDAIRLAGELITRGRAAIRIETTGRFLRSVTVKRENNQAGSTWRTVYLPNGDVLLRLVDTVIVS